MSEPDTQTTVCDLSKLAKSAPTRRELAWTLLKQTRNPVYVAMRYGYPIDTMREALEKIPDEKIPKKRKIHNAAATPGRQTFKRPSELLSEIEPGEKLPDEK